MKKGDIIIIVFILLIVSVLLIGNIVHRNSVDIKTVVITVDNKVVYEKVLTKELNDSFIIGKNKYNLIEIKDGYIYIKEANCSNQVCVNTGKISKVNEMIVCIPHKLTIEIKGSSKEIDIISE